MTLDIKGGEKYAKQRRYSAKKAVATSDISPLPKVVDKDRKKACRDNLQLFLETYFPEAFPLAWSPGHLEVIRSVERQIVEGGSIAIAMPRGSGKTTLIIRAAVWAVLYGKSPYAMIVAADARKAEKLLSTIKSLLRFNEALYADFPEVCHPIRSLQGLAINAAKQHIDGELTLIDWKASTAQLPFVEGSECSGAIIEVAGVTAAARGAQTTLPCGTVIRPTLVLIDDFQTRESAASPLQCKTRLDIIAGDLAGMKGPDQPLAMLAAVTVIYPEDGADQLINRDKNPEWRGVRQKMVNAWPTDEKLWDQYAELLLDAKRKDEPATKARQFYIDNREAMDEGSDVSWPERKDDDVSAIQHAYNLKLRIGEEAFNSEYQNTPDDPDDAAIHFLKTAEIAAKVNSREKGRIESDTEAVVFAIDVQQDHLWYGGVAWRSGFSGTILDYGAYPDQNRRFYTKRKLPKPLTSVEKYKDMTQEAAIYAAIQDLVDHIMSMTWTDDNGAVHRVSRILIDEGFMTDVVHLAIKQSPHRQVCVPTKGMGITATSLPISEWQRRKGEPAPRHPNWRLRISRGERRTLRSMHWDAYYWRTFVQKRFATDHGNSGCLSLWGENKVQHSQLAAHLTSQIPKVKEAAGSREVIEWQHKPTKPDDDLFDVLSMCCVAGSEQGVTLSDESRAAGFKKDDNGRLSFAEYLAKRKKAK